MSADPPPDDEAIDAMLRTVPHGHDDPPPDPARVVAWQQRLADQGDDAPADAEDAALAASPFARDLVAGLQEPLPPELAAWAESTVPRRRRWGWIAAPLALAAAALVAVVVGGGPARPGAYRLGAVEGQVAELRGAEPNEVPVFISGGVVRLWVTPAAADATPAAHAGLFALRDGRLTPVDAEVTAHDGAFELSAPAAAVFVDEGAHTLYVALGLDASAVATVAGRAPDAVDGVRLVRFIARYRGAPR